jgi:cyclin A
MRKQPDITNPMRVILVDWLVEVCDEFNLLPDTLFMSVSYVDRYLSLISIPRTKLQLVGVTGLYIAAKFEEIYPPEISEFAYITDDTYTKKQIVQMEREMLKVLQYNLIQPSSYTFLMRYLKVSERISINFDQITLLSQYLCELALQDAEPFLKYLPSVIASSALCLSRHSLNETPWPLILQYYSGYCIADLSNCIQDLHRTHSMAPCQQQQAIRVKYSSEKCMHIAIMKPTETLPL